MESFSGAPERPEGASASAAAPQPTPVAAAPARFAAAAFAAGAVAALTVADNRVGLNALLVSLGIAAAIALSGQRLATRWSPVWVALAGLLTAVALLRDAAWVVLPSLAAAAGFASLAVTGGRSWLGVGRGFLAAYERLPFGGPEVVRSAVSGLSQRSAAAAVPLLRGLALAAALLAIFGTLFISGDRAFAELAEGAVPSPRIDLLVAQVFWLIAVAAFCGSLVVGARAAVGDRELPEPRRLLVRAEWLPALAGLNLLFAGFVAVQATVLFGRDDHVLETAGLTYAEYAREGYGQLLVAAALTVAVTAGALRWADRARRSDDRLLRLLLASLGTLTLVVLASALHRLDLYQDAFGATRLRLAAEISLIWLGGAIAVVLAGLASGHYRWMPRVAALLSGLCLFGFALSDPDRRIADRNVERYAETGKIDVGYLQGLSADAVPALDGLPPSVRGDAVLAQDARLSEGDDWMELNLARERARNALAD